jgi:hypothetical protein
MRLNEESAPAIHQVSLGLIAAPHVQDGTTLHNPGRLVPPGDVWRPHFAFTALLPLPLVCCVQVLADVEAARAVLSQGLAQHPDCKELWDAALWCAETLPGEAGGGGEQGGRGHEFCQLDAVP